MTVSVIPRSKATTSTWSGGTTTEFYIFPKDGSYKDRRFEIRISSATVDLDASDFTMLPDYNRIITPLKGGFTLTYAETGKSETLKPLEEAFFDGGWHTHSEGKAVDFNVMYKKGLKAFYEIVNTSKEMLPAPHRFLYVPLVDASNLTGCTLNGIALTPDTLYVSDNPADAFTLVMKKSVDLIYTTVD
ncbi:MAG: HutD family protein [Acidaminococcus sp.]|jgi:environmental stress-induced protein Ves|nr:HutD family protein [Acidaminococcus sp.]MCI2100868.1 HutD family protein [Acidaminococcus sp.]MCI2115244.1 HutD family protein [Acidaminococcus sp.]MCI2117293.1 HutD family protein [Acidaminococcus sp.]